MENNAFEFRAVKQSVSSKEAAATLKVNIETIYKVIQETFSNRQFSLLDLSKILNDKGVSFDRNYLERILHRLIFNEQIIRCGKRGSSKLFKITDLTSEKESS